MGTILVTGARGQIGSDLAAALCERFGEDQVIRSDLDVGAPDGAAGLGRYEHLDVLDRERLEALVTTHRVETIYHLASLLSARGEQNPNRSWDVNVNGLKHVLDAARQQKLKVFWPSSIAVFGPGTPRHDTPQATVLDPVTMYGVTKVTGELLCQYYAQRFEVDVRSLRLPGIISYNAPPGGGTTDYAVEIFHAALQHGAYTSFLQPGTRLPMMYMPDAVRAVLDLMAAEASAIRVRTSYNVSAVSFSVEELVAEIQRHLPGFTCRYEPDFRQRIANSWPETIDDRAAREDWAWDPACDLPALVEDMLEKLADKRASRAEPTQGRTRSA